MLPVGEDDQLRQENGTSKGGKCNINILVGRIVNRLPQIINSLPDPYLWNKPDLLLIFDTLTTAQFLCEISHTDTGVY